MRSILISSKTSLGAFLLLFMVNDCSMQMQPNHKPFEEPIIYVSFTRWENRTFSPRVYYLLLQRYGLKNKLLNLPPYRGTTNNPAEVEEPNQNIDISTRFGFPGIGGSRGKQKRPILNKIFADRINQPLQTTDIIGSGSNGSTVHFPSTEDPFSQNSESLLLADRLEYPGESNRRPVPESSVEANNRDSNRQSQGTTLTDDDIIETNKLALDIMRISDWQDENVVFCPLSIANILAILLLGADGTTFKEIATQLRRHNQLNTVMDKEREVRFHTAFSNLLNILDSGANDQVTLETFSQIFVDKKFSLSKDFEEKAIQFYNAGSKTVDFENEGELFKQNVNKWISFKTKGKIESLVDTPPPATTSIALVNAVYFKGNWRSPFIPGITQMKQFTVSPSEIIHVPMMTNILTVPYLEEENFRVVGLPYKDNKTGMFVILPKNPGIKGLRELEQRITHESFDKLYSMKLTQVTIQMPKMRVESNGHIQEILSKLGVKTVFDQKYANFSRISDTNGLYIKSILHRAVMDVNEKGTEAAAATVATGDRNLDERPVLFSVNRPFIFCIVQVKAKTVLFWGRVTRPQPLPE